MRNDHQVLIWLKTVRDIDRSVARWHKEPQKYDFTVQCREGNLHSNTDAGFRRSLLAEKESGVVGALFLSQPTKHQW